MTRRPSLKKRFADTSSITSAGTKIVAGNFPPPYLQLVIGLVNYIKALCGMKYLDDVVDDMIMRWSVRRER